MVEEKGGPMKVDAKRAAKQRRLAAQLGEIGFALPGSLTVRAYRCGKQNCSCKKDPPRLHGPYAFWTRKVNNKTVTHMLNDEEVAEYQPMFDNARKIRDLVNELQELSLELIEPAQSSSTPQATKAPSASRPRARKPTKGQE
jgi:hypothetical protein